jgi:para-nitrobenzyl esterase
MQPPIFSITKNTFMRHVTFIAFAACMQACMFSFSAIGQVPSGKDIPLLTVEGGSLQGVPSETGGVAVYRGIPYAAPPVGDLRWQEPQPVIPWQGIRTASTWGNPCVQPDHNPGEFYQKEFFADGDPMRSEDCLYLNVWTPSPGQAEAKLPVAMWIHGGAYRAGWGHEPEMDGEAWAKRGVILVTINYRLGIYGFFMHPLLSAESEHGVSGNYGILDQIAALKWIHNNIAAFGGDPDNITVFGQSAGAGSVQQLVMSPLSKGLIDRAIIQSGGGLRGTGSDKIQSAEFEAAGKAMMDKAGATTLKQMRAMDWKAVINASDAYTRDTKKAAAQRPVTDGYVNSTDFTAAVLANKIADIPYMIGYVTKDGANSGQSVAAFCDERNKQSKQPVYSYHFSRVMPGDEAGAFHSAELWYIFGTLARAWRPFVTADYALGEKMLDYWTNFAKYGNPNGSSGNADWPAYTPQNKKFKTLDIDRP